MNPSDSMPKPLDERSFLECVLPSNLEEESLKNEAYRRKYRYFEVDLTHIKTATDLINEVAQTIKAASYFGGNWDALLDVITDLSWSPACGYIVLFKKAEALLGLPSDQLGIFLRVCLAAVERWQSGEDENGNAVSKTPFYFLFEGQEPFCRLLTDLAEEKRLAGGATGN